MSDVTRILSAIEEGDAAAAERCGGCWSSGLAVISHKNMAVTGNNSN